MKKLLSLLALAMLAPVLFAADAANDLILTQRKPDNSGNIQRNVPATGAITSGALGSFQAAIGMPFSQVIAKSADFTITTAQNGAVFNVTTGASNVTATMPTGAAGLAFILRKADAGAGGVLNSGTTTGSFTQGHSALIYWDTNTSAWIARSWLGSESNTGAITFTAGGSNQNITLNPSGTGQINTIAPIAVGANPQTLTAPLISVNKSGVTPSASMAATDAQTGFRLFGVAATQSSIINHGFGSNPVFNGYNANGTAAVPTATTVASGALARFAGGGFDGTIYAVNSELVFMPLETWSGSTRASSAIIRTTPLSSTTRSDTLTISGGTASTVTGSTGNMTIVSGSGASNTMTFKTTTSGSAVTTALTLDASQNTVLGNGLINPTGTSANSGNGMVQRFRNGYATAAQAPVATTRTYVTGSDVGPFTAGQLQVGTMIHWHLDITKTGAGTATATFDIAYGTAGTTADTARVSFTKPAGVGNIDHCAVDIYATIKTNSASGVVIGDFTLLDDQTGAGGFLALGKYVSSITTTSGTFDTTTPTHVGLCVTTGASDAWTINAVQTWTTNM